MAFMSSNPEVYITKWLETATKGNVFCVKAMFTNRLQFVCSTCSLVLTTSTDAVKADGTVDYSLQEFVKIHAHVGGHKDSVKPTGDLIVNDSGQFAGGQATFSAAQYVPLTADFKKIDLKPQQEAAIKAKIKEYDKLMERALDDKALAATIIKLQNEDKGKSPSKPIPVKPSKMGGYFDGNGGPWNPASDVDAELAETKAFENVLKLRVFQAAIKAQHAKMMAEKHVGTTPTFVKDKVLAQPTGRKFR